MKQIKLNIRKIHGKGFWISLCKLRPINGSYQVALAEEIFDDDYDKADEFMAFVQRYDGWFSIENDELFIVCGTTRTALRLKQALEELMNAASAK